MARKAGRETEQLWRERVERQAASGLSIQRFCDQQRISQATFYAWRKRLRERTGTPASGRDASCGAGTGQGDVAQGGELHSSETARHAGGLGSRAPRGYRVRVSGEVSATTLQCIVSVLDGRTHE